MTPATSCPPMVGNLRQRALAVAHRMLETRGEAGLTLRAIAAELNTGVASLYYHFANKDSLLAELAVDGFGELGRWMAMAAASPGVRTPFNASGHAYLGFTRHRPALYAIMYDERLQAGHPDIHRAEAEALAIYQRSLGNLGVSESEVVDAALAFWTLGRGIASISGRLDDGSPGATKQIVARVLNGLETLTGAPVAALSVARSDAA